MFGSQLTRYIGARQRCNAVESKAPAYELCVCGVDVKKTGSLARSTNGRVRGGGGGVLIYRLLVLVARFRLLSIVVHSNNNNPNTEQQTNRQLRYLHEHTVARQLPTDLSGRVIYSIDDDDELNTEAFEGRIVMGIGDDTALRVWLR